MQAKNRIEKLFLMLTYQSARKQTESAEGVL